MPLATPTVSTWVSLILDLGYVFTAAPAKHSHYSSKAQPLLLTLDEGYLLTAALPDLQCGIAPLGPPAPAQPQLLGSSRIAEARLQQYMNCELPVLQAGFRKGRGTRDQIANIAGSWKKQESSRKTSISALLTISKPLTEWVTINCGKF